MHDLDDDWGADDLEDWERNQLDLDDYEERRWPDFGCACENALIVDTVCAGCIEIMQAQERAYVQSQEPRTNGYRRQRRRHGYKAWGPRKPASEKSTWAC